MTFQSWLEILNQSLTGLLNSVVAFVPHLLGAIVIFIVGLVVAMGLEALTDKIVKLLKVDALLQKVGFEAVVERGGLKLDSGMFLGRLVYWFIMIGFLIAVSDILGLPQFSQFLNSVMLYLPNVFAAIIIALATVLVANVVKIFVISSVRGAQLAAADLMGTLAWWAIFLFGMLTALSQLQVAQNIILTILTGVVAMFALAGGIAFGMGGKEYAARLVDRFRQIVES